MKRLIILMILVCVGLIITPIFAFTQIIKGGGSPIVPATNPDFLVGGKEGPSWSIGNCVPYDTPEKDMVISTCDDNDRSNPDNWKEQMRITKEGNVGIGTRDPQTKLHVEGNAMITAGLMPNYDSGWIADNNSTNHQTVFTHNLGVIPKQVTILFATSTTSTTVYPIIWSWVATYSGNPVTVEMTATNFILNIYSGTPLHGVWKPPYQWTFYNTGYWRVLLWI